MRRVIVVTLAVLAGCIAATVPNLVTTVQRSKQKATSGRLYDWAAALEAYGTRHGGYPTLPPGPVARLVRRTGIRLPVHDAWGRDIIYHGVGNHYLLHSLGRDGRNDFVAPGRAARTFDEDLVYGDGVFVQPPGGL